MQSKKDKEKQPCKAAPFPPKIQNEMVHEANKTMTNTFQSKKTFLGDHQKRKYARNLAYAVAKRREGGIGRTSTIRNFLHAFQAPSMTDSLPDAVSATGPLSAHGKDKPGIGAPNSLKQPPFIKYE